jgi:hypothetical protein
MKIQLFKPLKNSDGDPVGVVDIVRVIARKKGWSLSWHARSKSCKVGVYRNATGNDGLQACLNLPLFGDFSLWRFSSWKSC